MQSEVEGATEEKTLTCYLWTHIILTRNYLKFLGIFQAICRKSGATFSVEMSKDDGQATDSDSIVDEIET